VFNLQKERNKIWKGTDNPCPLAYQIVVEVVVFTASRGTGIQVQSLIVVFAKGKERWVLNLVVTESCSLERHLVASAIGKN